MWIDSNHIVSSFKAVFCCADFIWRLRNCVGDYISIHLLFFIYFFVFRYVDASYGCHFEEERNQQSSCSIEARHRIFSSTSRFNEAWLIILKITKLKRNCVFIFNVKTIFTLGFNHWKYAGELRKFVFSAEISGSSIPGWILRKHSNLENLKLFEGTSAWLFLSLASHWRKIIPYLSSHWSASEILNATRNPSKERF